jgi:hypothetical protein
MAKQTILPALDQSFTADVATLAKEGRQIAKAYISLTERLIVFAEQFAKLRDQAKALDKREGGAHAQYLLSRVASAMKMASRQSWSKWITIGKQSQALLPYKENIPPTRDSLYELSVALKNGDNVGQWVADKRITIDSSVREVAALRTKKNSRKTVALKPRRNVKKNYPTQILLSFTSYSSAATTLLPILNSSDDFKVTTADKAFKQALRSMVDDDTYDKLNQRFS